MVRSLAHLGALSLVLVAGCPSSLPVPVPVPMPVPDSGVAGAAGGMEGGAAANPAAQLAKLAVAASYADGDRRRRDPSDLCETVRENLDRAARAIVAQPTTGTPVAAPAWDRKTPPKFMDLVDGRFTLTSAEKALLKKNGFVVPSRLVQRGYADAFHDIYQSQLPIYVSADAILHAIFKSNDAVLAGVELALAPRLEALLLKMHEELKSARAAYPTDVAADVDLYLTVARSLLAEADVKAVLGADAEAAPLVAKARAGAGGLSGVMLFGRSRVVDFSQYGPRGHYATNEVLQRYFRASMWLSRLELNLVSRASRSSQPGISPNPEETPREAVDALAIADLAERARVVDEIDAFDSAWAEFAGKREDVSIRALLALRAKAGIGKLSVPDSAERLKAAIGNGFARTTRIHYMPQGSVPLPVIATMLGPRIVADSQAETDLVHAAVENRAMPSFADVAFMLGHERAKKWLAGDLVHFPALGPNLEKGKALIGAAGAGDMYAAWLGAIRGLADVPAGVMPSYMKSEAFADLRVGSAVAAYGQLRHNYVLLAGQTYDEGGCEVPDGYVEPALAVYEALAVYARRGAAAMKRLGDPHDPVLGESASYAAYFAKLESTMKVLVAMSKHELAGLPLSDEEKRWISMVVEIVPPSSDGPGSMDGWYFDLFPGVADAFAEHAFLADWFTSSNANAVVYAGATAPRLGVFVVDTGGEPRMMVGPVARGFEHVGKLDTRLKDTDVAKLRDLREPWAASYTAPPPAAPPLQVINLDYSTFAVRSTRSVGAVTFELLDHHRAKLSSKTVTVGPSWTRVSPPTKEGDFAEALRVRAGEMSFVVPTIYGTVNEAVGGMRPVAWDGLFDLQEKIRHPAQ